MKKSFAAVAAIAFCAAFVAAEDGLPSNLLPTARANAVAMANPTSAPAAAATAKECALPGWCVGDQVYTRKGKSALETTHIQTKTTIDSFYNGYHDAVVAYRVAGIMFKHKSQLNDIARTYGEALSGFSVGQQVTTNFGNGGRAAKIIGIFPDGSFAIQGVGSDHLWFAVAQVSNFKK